LAFQITSIAKRENGTYRIGAQDTEDQTGINEASQPIYQQYYAIHNPKDSAEITKEKFKYEISLQKKRKADDATVEAAIKMTVESIDVAEIVAAK